MTSSVIYYSTDARKNEIYLLNRPLSRDVTHDELRVGRHVGGKTKKEQKKFLKKYVNNIEYNR